MRIGSVNMHNYVDVKFHAAPLLKNPLSPASYLDQTARAGEKPGLMNANNRRTE